MDYVFWVPWAIEVFIFVVWVVQPIREFAQIWKRHNQDDK